MAALGMRKRKSARSPFRGSVVEESSWVRARRGGILRLSAQLGQKVARKELLGVIADVFGAGERTITAPMAGVVIGHTTNPLAHQGDAIIHIAKASDTQEGERGA